MDPPGANEKSVAAWRTWPNVAPFWTWNNGKVNMMRTHGVNFYCNGAVGPSGPPMECSISSSMCWVPLLLLGVPWLGIALWRLGVSLYAPDAVIAALVHVVTFAVLWILTSCRDPGIVPRGYDQASWERDFPELLLTPAEAAQQRKGGTASRADAESHPSGALARSSGVGWAWRQCTICECARPPGVMHCRTCGHCVMGLDHHCPIFGVCIGARNIHTFRFAIVFGYGSLFILATTLPLIALDLAAEFAPRFDEERWGELAARARPWLMVAAHGGALVHFIAWAAVMLAFLRLEHCPHACAPCAPWIRNARVLGDEKVAMDAEQRGDAAAEADENAGAPSESAASVPMPTPTPVPMPTPTPVLPLASAKEQWLWMSWVHGLSTVMHWVPRQPLLVAAVAPNGVSRRTCAPGVKAGNRFNRSAHELAAMRGGGGIWSGVWSRWPSRTVSLLMPHERISLTELSASSSKKEAEKGRRREEEEEEEKAGEEEESGLTLRVGACGCGVPTAAELQRIREA